MVRYRDRFLKLLVFAMISKSEGSGRGLSLDGLSTASIFTPYNYVEAPTLPLHGGYLGHPSGMCCLVEDNSVGI